MIYWLMRLQNIISVNKTRNSNIDTNKGGGYFGKHKICKEKNLNYK